MKYAIVDIETTGGNPKSSKITEIAIYIHDGVNLLDEYQTLVNPEIPIPEFIARLTHITDDMVKDAPRFFEVAKDIVKFTEDCIFVAHNVSFDYKVLRAEFKSLGFDYRRDHLCTVRASKYVIPGYKSYSLGKISRDLGIKIEGRHRAWGDALATTKLFAIIFEKDPDNLNGFIQNEVNPKLLHPNLNIDDLEEFPNKPGVYYFYDNNDKLIYIGKSKHIKKRIEQHLINHKTKKAVEMKNAIAHIKYSLTGSELVALLKESKEIKEFRPKFNRAQKKISFPLGLYQFTDQLGYMNLYLDRVNNVEANPITTFTTKASAKPYIDKIVEEFQLCQKLCGISHGGKTCFNFQIKTCNGACIQEESSEDYNNRVDAFIEKYTLENQIIFDKGRHFKERAFVLIENGLYQGYGYIPYNEYKVANPKVKKYLEQAEHNRDAQSIIKMMLRTNPKLELG